MLGGRRVEEDVWGGVGCVGSEQMSSLCMARRAVCLTVSTSVMAVVMN